MPIPYRNIKKIDVKEVSHFSKKYSINEITNCTTEDECKAEPGNSTVIFDKKCSDNSNGYNRGNNKENIGKIPHLGI